jgi:hypothetical protein
LHYTLDNVSTTTLCNPVLCWPFVNKVSLDSVSNAPASRIQLPVGIEVGGFTWPGGPAGSGDQYNQNRCTLKISQVNQPGGGSAVLATFDVVFTLTLGTFTGGDPTSPLNYSTYQTTTVTPFPQDTFQMPLSVANTWWQTAGYPGQPLGDNYVLNSATGIVTMYGWTYTGPVYTQYDNIFLLDLADNGSAHPAQTKFFDQPTFIGSVAKSRIRVRLTGINL